MVRHLAENRSEQTRFSYFLHHPQVQLDQVIFGAVRAGRERVQQEGHPHVLVSNDTTEINLKHVAGYHHGRDLGVTGNNSDPGFFIHAGFALDAQQGHLLGCASLHVWTRGGTQGFGASESQKWFNVAREVQTLAPQVTLVQDREGDIYDHWTQLLQRGLHLVTRARQDRAVLPAHPAGSGRLFETMAAFALCGRFTLHLAADEKKGRAARQSVMEVRFGTAKLRSPRVARKGRTRGSVTVNAVEVRECEASVPEGQAPVVWRLLTSHAIHDFQGALQIVRWYMFRWRAEECFAALKTRSFDVEASRLESGSALMKLGVMSLWSAATVTELVKRRDDEITDASAFFEEEQLQCLEDLLPVVEGRTERQQNPYRKRSVAWAVWVLARLGRWHGTDKPGIQVIRRGLERFDAIFLGWNVRNRI